MPESGRQCQNELGVGSRIVDFAPLALPMVGLVRVVTERAQYRPQTLALRHFASFGREIVKIRPSPIRTTGYLTALLLHGRPASADTGMIVAIAEPVLGPQEFICDPLPALRSFGERQRHLQKQDIARFRRPEFLDPIGPGDMAPQGILNRRCAPSVVARPHNFEIEVKIADAPQFFNRGDLAWLERQGQCR